MRELSHSGRAPQRAGWCSLPSEIRLMIYPLTWEARRVTMRHYTPPELRRSDNWIEDDKLKYPITCRSIPATVHLNYEARQATLQHYLLMFGDPTLPGGEDTATYFNPALDILCISRRPYFYRATLMNPSKSMQRFLDIVTLAERIILADGWQFYSFTEDLMVARNLLPKFAALRSVDASYYHDDDSSWLRVRLCSDPKCTEQIYDEYYDGSWRVHKIRCSSTVKIPDTGAIPYRPCREMVASLPEGNCLQSPLYLYMMKKRKIKEMGI